MLRVSSSCVVLRALRGQTTNFKPQKWIRLYSTPSNMDGVDFLISDHRHVEALFEQFKTANDPPTKRRLVNEIIRQLSIHTVIEERFLYPLCKSVIQDDDEGKKLSEHGLKEHRKIKEILDGLLDLDENSKDFDETVQTTIKKTLHHHGDEEKDIFPQLRAKATKEQLLEFGQNLAEAKKTAPTHPHPHAPDQPPFNSIVGPVLHAVDAILDTSRVFPGDGTQTTTHTDKKNEDVTLQAKVSNPPSH